MRVSGTIGGSLSGAKTARQQLLYQQDDTEKWYKGQIPTASEIAARIVTVAKTDKQTAATAFDTLKTLQQEPSSPLYAPYTAPTNSALGALYSLGIDTTGGITDQWIQKYSYLKDYYRIGAGGTPLAPSSKSAPEENQAYYYYKVLQAEDITRKAETEWSALQEEINYWTDRTDRNYSDEQVLAKIDWSKYPTLAALDEDKKIGTPTALNRAIDYSQDTINGALYAARNKSTGSVFADSVKYAMEDGSGYRPNAKVTNALNPESKQYNPYAVGSTVDDAALYFGVSSFSQTWTAEHKSILSGSDKAAIKYYNQVQAAEDTTVKAESEWNKLQNEIGYWLQRTDRNYSDEEILSQINLDNYPTLKKLDAGRNAGDPVALTRAVSYNGDNLSSYVANMRSNNKIASAYTPNDEIAQKLDPTSETYSPYSVGSTIDDAALYFSMTGFDAQWLVDNKNILASGDKTAIKYYREVYDAEQFTQAAEKERASLETIIDNYLLNTSDPDVILTKLQGMMLSDYPTLRKLDTSLQTAELLPTTRAIDCRWQDIEKEVRDRCAEINNANANVLNVRQPDSTGAVNAIRNGIINTAGGTIAEIGTPAERDTFNYAYDADFSTYVGQIKDQIDNGKIEGPQIYGYALSRANDYAAQNYMAAKAIVTGYEDAVAKRDAAKAELAAQQAAGVNTSVMIGGDIGKLNLTVSENEQYITKNQAKYTKAKQEIAEIVDAYTAADEVGTMTGANLSSGIVPAMDFANAYGREYVPTDWSAQTAYESALIAGYSYADVAPVAQQQITTNKRDIEQIDTVLNTLTANKVKVDASYVSNLQRRKAALERDTQDAQYFLLQSEPDFDKVVSEYTTHIKAAWKGKSQGIFGGGEQGGTDFLTYTMTSPEYGINNNFAPAMSENERKTFLYLSYTKGKDAAEAYYAHVTDPTYGVVNTRQAERLQELAADFANQSALGATLTSILASPLQLAGAVYAVGATITGQEVNPNNPAFAPSLFVQGTRQTVKQNITTQFGEGSVGSFVANLGYDAVTAAADSLLSGALGGGSAYAAVSLMSAGAGAQAIQNAKVKGATDAQAMLMGGITFVSEAATEFIPMDRWLRVLKSGSPKSVKDLMKYALTSMFAEGIGESANQIAESVADTLIMQKLSDRERSISRYIDGGMNAQAAAKQADADFWNDVLYAGIVGAVSAGGTTLAGYSAGRIINGKSGPQQMNRVAQFEQIVREAATPQTTAPEVQAEPVPQTAAPEVQAEPVPQAQGEVAPVQEIQVPETVMQEVPATSPAGAVQQQVAPEMILPQQMTQAELDAFAGTEQPAQIEPLEPYRRARKSDATLRSIVALDSVLSTKDVSSQTATIAASLAETTADTEASVAASKALVKEYGAREVVKLIRDIKKTGVQGAEISVIAAVLSNDPNVKLILDDLVANGVDAFGGQALVYAARKITDQAAIQSAINESMVADRVKELIGGGALQGIQPFETALAQAQTNVREALAQTEKAQREQKAANDNLQIANARFVQDPTAPSVRNAISHAISQAAGAKVVSEQSQSSVDKYETQRAEAKKMLDSAKNNAMRDIREQARQDVAQKQTERETSVKTAMAQKAMAATTEPTAQTQPTKDSDGNILTPQQREFFKDSKIVDTNGNLLVMHNGAEKPFAEFDYNLVGRNSGGKLGGFWFTSNLDNAASYADRQLLSGYLNITNPLSMDSVTLTKDKLISFMDRLAEGVKTSVDFGNQTKNNRFAETLLRQNKSDYSVVEAFYRTIKDPMQYKGFYALVNSELGFDGFYTSHNGETVGVAFRPSQFYRLDGEMLTGNTENLLTEPTAPAENTGKRQFANETAQQPEAMPEWLQTELRNNPAESDYERQTNQQQMQDAWDRVQKNGYDQTVQELLDKDNFDTLDNATANVVMAKAFHDGDAETALAMASKYNREGTKTGQALQSRQIFTNMSQTGVRAFVGGQIENMTKTALDKNQPKKARLDAKAQAVSERATSDTQMTETTHDDRLNEDLTGWQRALIDQYDLNKTARPGIHYNRATTKQRMLEAILATPNLTAENISGLVKRLEYLQNNTPVVTEADLDYIGARVKEYTDTAGSDPRAASIAMGRAMEAYANLVPETLRNKMRTYRYVAMLLSVPTTVRNLIGNVTQGGSNIAAHRLAVGLDAAISAISGNRTVTNISAKERADGWRAFVDETKNTWNDFVNEKVNTRDTDAAKFDMSARGRVFQNQTMETIRHIEGFLMSVGDRNFWKKAFVNSMAEQQKLVDSGKLTATSKEMQERAEAEANYAIFTEDNAVRDLLGKWKKIPGIGEVLDFIVPFIGVPSNIIKRMWQYSPLGLASTAIQHGLNAIGMQVGKTKVGQKLNIQGKPFHQYQFVMGMARGLTGTGLFGLGMLLRSIGMIRMGTGDEKDMKVVGVRQAQGDQYSPYIQNPFTGEYVSLGVLAPFVSPITMGAAAYDIFDGDEDMVNATINAAFSSINQIVDTSYLSTVQEMFDKPENETLPEHVGKTILGSMVSQNVPNIISQLASALDPYVRDTNDKNWIVNTLNRGLQSKIPGWRNELPEKIDVTGQPVQNAKAGWRSMVDPFTSTVAKNDPALTELLRVVDAVGKTDFLPSDALAGKANTLTGVARPLTPAEKEEYKIRYGTLAFDGGETVDKAGNAVSIQGIRELMDSPAYQSMTDDEKATAIGGQAAAAKAAAIAEMSEQIGATKAQPADTSYKKKAPGAMPSYFENLDTDYMKKLNELYARTGDGAFIPTAISNTFSRKNKKSGQTEKFTLNSEQMDTLWQYYGEELLNLVVGTDWNANEVDLAKTMTNAYQTAQSRARDRWVKENQGKN